MKSLLTANQILLFFVFLFAHSLYGQSDIVINEFMASNDSSVADQDGDFDDWIELYNNTDSDIVISGYMLSDDSMEPGKFVFPNGATIAKDGYIIIWCDDDQEQEGFHTGFKLSGGGEEIVLTDPSGIQIDYIEYGEQQTDMTSARVPNGTGDFVIGEHTHNANNDITSSLVELTNGQSGIKIFPNPASQLINIQLNTTEIDINTVSIYNAIGQRESLIPYAGSTIDVSHLTSGIYFVIIDDVYTQKIIIDQSH